MGRVLSVLLALLAALLVAPPLYFRLLYRSDWSAQRGTWAVVTGSSYGIGREVAAELASRGLHVVVNGRSVDKLEALCVELRATHKVQCRVIVQDVIKSPDWERVAKEVEGLDVSVLVNNIGGGTIAGQFKFLHEHSLAYHQQLLDFNWGSAFGWTHLLLPRMLNRGGGRIVMCSSLAYVAGFKESVYGPAKSALHGLVRVINNEYDTIRAETWIIGPVSTPTLSNVEPDGVYIVSAKAFAANAVRLFGYYEEYAPVLFHGAANVFMPMLPTSIRAYLAREGSGPIFKLVEDAHKSETKKEL
jgi:short-subunit dehydrogenase